MLALDGQINALDLQNIAVIGELEISGLVRPITGILPMVAGAKNAGFSKVAVPVQNQEEAALVDGIELFPVGSLQEAVSAISGGTQPIARAASAPVFGEEPYYYGDFADVRGQESTKRALEVAAGGGHHVLLVGPSGAGKTMLARRFSSILPPLTEREALDIARVYSIAGLLGSAPELPRIKPFRFPHHTISLTDLQGGGATVRPGELSLSDHGTLFLEDITEFSRAALERLRQPLEEGVVTISRAAGTFTFPARFTLIGSMSGCACGFANVSGAECRCDAASIQRHRAKISGPLLDRLDIQVQVNRVPFDEMVRRSTAEKSAAIRQRVIAARERQESRFAGTAIGCNAEIPASQVRDYCAFDDEAMTYLAQHATKREIPALALDRIARVARTIADLAGTEAIQSEHIAEALGYRALDKVFHATTAPAS